MRNAGAWWMSITLLFPPACGGKQLNDVGDVNDGDDRGGAAGSATGGTSPTGGQGGAAGASGGSTATDGAPPDIGACDAGDGCLFEEGTDVRGLTADATTLYWIEYGTTDELGNYANDGRLLARDFDSDEVRTLATGLEGPVDVRVSEAHAYVFLDRYWDGGATNALVRLPLAGGSAELVQAHSRAFVFTSRSYESFVSDGANAYFSTHDGIYWATESRAEALVLVEPPVGRMAVDHADGYVYFEREADEVYELWRVPLAGGTTERILEETFNHFQVAGDFVYAMDPTSSDPLVADDGVYYLSQTPKDGGAPWTRLLRRPGTGGFRIQVREELVFHDNGLRRTAPDWEIVQGRLDTLASSEPIVSLSREAQFWIGTPAGVFWVQGFTQDSNIYRRENAQ
jgi:hypothetical protein